MCTIGLGKQTGAHQAHSHGLWDSVRAVPKLQLAKAKILCGVAVVENGYRQPLRRSKWSRRPTTRFSRPTCGCSTSRSSISRTIPFDELDLLIVDELGKTISGAGMDPNVIGHWRNSRCAAPAGLTAASSCSR